MSSASEGMDPGLFVLDGSDGAKLLMGEVNRQLTICNACRYCEGLCAVFPALERRTLFETGDISQIANLCHDCRACYDACMYTAPHEFALNVPRVLAEVRVNDYQRYVWPRNVPRLLSGWRGIAWAGLLAVVLVALVAIAHAGVGGLFVTDHGPASPYKLIPYDALLAVLLVPFGFAVIVLAFACRSYWRDVDSGPLGLPARVLWYAFRDAATLRYLKGGGTECFYPEDDVPSGARRWLHTAVAYGFGLCIVSTVSAAIQQDLLGSNPPYQWISVPVLSGTLGGIAITVGCAGLIVLKTRASRVTGASEMVIKDYGLLVALTFLAGSGLATLLTRTTPAFGIVFLIHLAAIVLAFAAMPYTKFVHVLFRLLALVHDHLEIATGWTQVTLMPANEPVPSQPQTSRS